MTATQRPLDDGARNVTVRVYADMCGDLFHFGHVNLLRRARALGDELVCGVHNDADMASYKYPPVLTMQERIAVIETCRYVDRVIPNAPTRPDAAYLDALNIAIVCHGDDFTPQQLQYFYGDIGVHRRLVLLPYTRGISSSEIVRRVRDRASSTTLGVST